MRQKKVFKPTENANVNKSIPKKEPQAQKNSAQVSKYSQIEKDENYLKKTPTPTPTRLKNIYLTFDDGPWPETTDAILDVLQEYEVKATFFMNGINIKNHPNIARRVIKEGHEIGNHTYAHKDLTKLEDLKVSSEITSTNKLIEALGGKTIWVRPPYGAMSKRVDQLIKNQEMMTVFWTIDPMDWQKKLSGARLLQRITSHLHDEGIIILHDTKSRTAMNLPLILEDLKAKGYVAKKLSERKTLPGLDRKAFTQPQFS